ncbi:hypothetical protein TRVL_09756 [Trypanosoma vivax]|nr:hypothetical protein TRVL_09756 [Trypanosoma vivax]
MGCHGNGVAGFPLPRVCLLAFERAMAWAKRRHHEIAKPLRGLRARFYQRLLRVALVSSSVPVSLVKRTDLRTIGLRSERRRSLAVRRSPHRLAPSGSQKANHRKALVSYYFPLLFGSD